MKVVAYYRVSTDKQVSSGLGLEAQKSKVEAFCAASGWEIVSSHTDEGISGKTETLNRPALVDALTSIHLNKAEVLVTAKIDRLSRDVVVQRSIESALKKLGARFVSASGEGTESQGHEANLIKTILSAVAENEAALIGIRTKAALAAAKEKGIHVGRPPLGFEVGEGGKLRPGIKFHFVQLILFYRYIRGYSFQSICDELNANKDKTGRIFNYPTVRNVVKRWGNRADWLHGIEEPELLYRASSQFSDYEV
jgi:DNA invertase Pin-like site-specific DNA recombinase